MRPRMPDPGLVLPRLRAVADAGIYSNRGPQVIELEARLARLLGIGPAHVAMASSATTALTGAVALSDAERFIVPSFTFTATPAAVLNAGRALVWGDIDETGWWLSDDVERPAHGSGRADGLVPVVPFGGPLDQAFARYATDREVVLDAAASLGSSLSSLSGLSPTWAVVFSLHATKVLPAGEGGIVVFGDPARAQRFRSWTNFGLSGSRESQLVGSNAKMSEHTACWAHASLDGWETERSEWHDARSRVVALSDRLGLQLALASRDGANPYWIGVFDDVERTDAVEETLRRAGIGTRRWWTRGCHRMPAYAGVPAQGTLEVTERVAARTLGLPMFRGISDQELDRIGAALRAALA
jgi:dTDP-4-amino-4,6-dideoxygalactose transaminase